MLAFPKLRNIPPSDRLWRWFQSLVRTTAPDPSGVIRVNPRQVYILPTRFGILYGAMLFAMLFGSNNYGSNPGFLLTFLLTGLGMAALFQTWKNLVGIELTTSNAEAVFCGTDARYPFRLHNTYDAPRAGIGAYIDGHQLPHATRVDLDPESDATLTVSKATSKRGTLPVDRVVLETSFPLGLFRAWAYVEADHNCLVYPKPAEVGSGLDYWSSEVDTINVTETGNDDFVGHKAYQSGDSVMHVDWKVVARGKGWWLKNFSATKGEQVWLRWQETKGEDPEQKLSHLSRAVLELDRLDIDYGLEIPGCRIEPAAGVSHRHQCLKMLALFNYS